jgi:hypothetical protein
VGSKQSLLSSKNDVFNTDYTIMPLLLGRAASKLRPWHLCWTSTPAMNSINASGTPFGEIARSSILARNRFHEESRMMVAIYGGKILAP